MEQGVYPQLFYCIQTIIQQKNKKMKKLLPGMFLLVFAGVINAQQDSVNTGTKEAYTVKSISPDSMAKKRIIYKIELWEMNGKFNKGYLANITDEEVLYMNERGMFGTSTKNQTAVGYRVVKKIWLQRNNGAGRGALKGFLIGAGVGLFAGAIAGMAGSGSSSSSFQIEIPFGQAILGGMAFGEGIGGILGLFFGGTSQKTFKLNRNKEKHSQMKVEVLQKIYGQQLNPQTSN